MDDGSNVVSLDVVRQAGGSSVVGEVHVNREDQSESSRVNPLSTQ